MCDFMVRKWSSVAVRLAHEGADHVRFFILKETRYQEIPTEKRISQRTVLVPSFLALIMLM